MLVVTWVSVWLKVGDSPRITRGTKLRIVLFCVVSLGGGMGPAAGGVQ